MKANIYDLEGKTIKEIELPEYFAQDYRPDLIKKAVISSQSKGYQATGVSPYSNRDYTSIYKVEEKQTKQMSLSTLVKQDYQEQKTEEC